MSWAYLVSATLMGMLVVAILAAVGQNGRWYDYRPEAMAGDGESLLDRSITWTVAFAVLALGAIAGVVALAVSPGSSASLLILFAGALVVLYVLLGMYITARQRGHSNAMAAAETATVAGSLFLLAIAAQLLGG